MESKVRVLCDGKEIPLVPFVAKLIGDTILALTRNLKGGENAKEITISVKST